VKKNIFFHVGTVKTGTTLIQKILWENRNALQKFNFHYYDQIEPKLAYPRYANAEFLFDKTITLSNEEINTYLHKVKEDNIIISEEGLWANIDYRNNPIFDGFNKKIILYVRKSAEVISAWASENAEPYNAIQKLHSSGIGVVSIEKGIEEFTRRYKTIFEKFFKSINEMENIEVIIRPYEREQFEDRDVFKDFINILGIKTDDLLDVIEYKNIKIANSSKSRKYCDISVAIWDILVLIGKESEYSLKLVNYVYHNCESGDDRSVIETLDDETILTINKELKFIEEYISVKYLNNENLFKNSSLSKTNNKIQYKPISIKEVETLVYDFITQSQAESERINKIRDLALEFEKNNDVYSAYTLMSLANKLRPKGPFIEKKYLEYKNILKK